MASVFPDEVSMELLTTLFPSAFIALALAHFVALLSPGPDFFLLIGFATRHRLRGSAGLCVGIAAGNGLYILLVILGSSALRQFTQLLPVGKLSHRQRISRSRQTLSPGRLLSHPTAHRCQTAKPPLAA
jgi:hypothetical protein